MGGPLGVDFFLVATAMLAAHQLLPQLEGSANGLPRPQHRPAAAVLRYWRRRAVRLLPAYGAANLLSLVALGPREGMAAEQVIARDFAFGNCPAGMWRNALLITNWDFTKGCGEPAMGGRVAGPAGHAGACGSTSREARWLLGMLQSGRG